MWDPTENPTLVSILDLVQIAALHFTLRYK